MKIATAARNAMCQAFTDLFDASSNPAYLEIRAGTEPSHPGDMATGNLLATIVLPQPAFGTAGTAGAGVNEANAVDVVQGVGNGTAGYFRAYDGDDNVIEDGTVSVTGGAGEAQLNTLTISTGVDVALTSWSVTMPEA